MGMWERLGIGLLVFGFLVGSVPAMGRIVRRGCTDFPDFCYAGKYVLEHGVRAPDSNLLRYWPSVDVPFVLFACLPLPVAGGLWYALGCWSWIGLWRTIQCRLLPGADELTRRHVALAAALLALPLALDGLCLGAFHVFMVWLMAAGLWRAGQGQWRSGGLLLGIATWMKLLPLLGIGYLLLKRQWKPALTALLCALAIDASLSLAAYGPRNAWKEHVLWWNHGAAGSVHRQMTNKIYVDEDRLSNQSLAVTLRRLFSSLGSELSKTNVFINVADLSPTQLRCAYFAASGLLGLGILWFCRRPACATSPEQWAREIALIVLAMLWFSPVVWSYHVTAATPALAIALARWREHSLVKWFLVAAWMASLVLLAWPIARAAGDLFWMGLLLGAAVVWPQNETSVRLCS
jgi:hypothetical protein